MSEIDRRSDLKMTMTNQLWRLVSGPLTLFLIPFFLSKEAQGYWYLFLSLSALSVLADLGFSNVISIFSGHEIATLELKKSGRLGGDEEQIAKLGKLFRFSVGWAAKIALVAFPVIFSIGLGFLVKENALGTYWLPWLLFSFGSMGNFVLTCVLSFVEGTDQVARVQKVRFSSAVLASISSIVALVSGFGIYALVVGVMISLVATLGLIWAGFANLVLQLWQTAVRSEFKWKKSILPFFSKYAVSSFSGYFTYQIFTPIAQFFLGPAESGRIGISVTLVISVFSLSNVWIASIIPRMNILASRKEIKHLDQIFQKRFFLGILTYLALSSICISFFLLCGNYAPLHRVVERFVPVPSLLLLLVAFLFQVVITAWAIFMRSFQKEPLAVLFVLASIWTTVLTFVVGYLRLPLFLFGGIVTSYLFVLPFGAFIFANFRNSCYGAQKESGEQSGP